MQGNERCRVSFLSSSHEFLARSFLFLDINSAQCYSLSFRYTLAKSRVSGAYSSRLFGNYYRHGLIGRSGVGKGERKGKKERRAGGPVGVLVFVRP